MADIKPTDQDWLSVTNTYAAEALNLRVENAMLRRTIVEMETAQAANTPAEAKPKGK